MLVIHIGYHKTGTTWLRHRLFNREDLKFHLVSRYSHEMGALLHPHALDFDPNACRRRFTETIDRCDGEGRIAVIMHERLSGDPHSGGYDSKEMAERLHRTFPEARILIGIREQRSMILSCYKQYLKYGGACSLQDYVNAKRDHRLPLFSQAHFRYHRLIAHYRTLFGASRVLVQPYEKFRSDPASYVRALAGFCGIEVPDELPYGDRVNVPMKPVALKVKRVLNPFIRRDSLNANSPYVMGWLGRPSHRALQFLDRAVPESLNGRVEESWKRTIEDATRGYYEESNRQTSSLIGAELGAQGYRT
jgi:hypothetical protein